MDSVTAAQHALDEYARERGRSALVRVHVPGRDWEGGVEPDTVRPAASLLKLGVALAAEAALAHGRLDRDLRVPIADLASRPRDRSVLDLLDPDHPVRVDELLALMLGASDNPSTRWFVAALGVPRIADTVASLGCTATTVEGHPQAGVTGTTTCRDALVLLAAASDPQRHPLSARALEHSIRNSRIPLGATDADIRIAHKTGTMTGLAHDVAVLECDGGRAEVAFLTEDQHDTLITGYAMGMCTREILQAWGLSARATVSATGG